MAKKKKQDFEQTKTDVEPWSGGVKVNLNKKVKGDVIRDVLSRAISPILDAELKNHEKFIKKIEKWNRQYRGIKPSKTYPHAKAANTATPLTRSRVDTVAVRIMDAIFSQQKIWVFRALEEWAVDLAPKIEDGVHWWAKYIAKVRKTIFSPLLQSLKIGTGIIMVDYERRKRTTYRYATSDEKRTKDIRTYKTPEGEDIVKVPQTIYDGPVLRAISREDFVISSDATSIYDAHLVGYRTYVPRATFDFRVKTKYYDITQEDAEKIQNDELDETKRKRIADSNKEYDEDIREFVEVWRLWYRYDVDDDGEVDDIIIDIHKNSGVVLKADYNHLFFGFRPFKELVFNPIEFSFDGEGMCGILEKIQEEIDTLHNLRIDRLHQINVPVYLTRMNSEAENLKKVEPGLIVRTEEPDLDLRMLEFSDNYPSTFTEEQILTQYADQAVGISPYVMGQSTSERPVAREALALIQEANKKFKVGIDNLRADLADLGLWIVEMFAQYKPRYEYKIEKMGANGQYFEKDVVDFPFELIRDGLAVDLMASSEVMNTEIRREIDLTLYQLLSDYYTKLAGMVQMMLDVNVPPDMKPLMQKWSLIFEKLMERIVRDFGNVDAESLVDHIPEEVADMAIAQQIDQIVQQAVQQALQEQGQQFQQEMMKMQEEMMAQQMPPGVQTMPPGMPPNVGM